MQLELLAPAGNVANLKAAINAGANAVYLGLDEFSARAKATEFNLGNLEEWARYCHMFGVKVYLAINTIIKQNELERAIAVARQSHECGVDALIVQDLGFAYMLASMYPDIVLHASTQMGVHNLYGARAATSLGIDRIVLARESVLEDIVSIRRNTNVEIEAFVHGALCVAFSGNCLYSSVLSGYSGNRGKCMQLCRKEYTQNIKSLTKKPLNASELCLAGDIKKLVDAGVDSLKIEGRLRREEYVLGVVSKYREIIDKSFVCKQGDIDELIALFDRGEVTKGHIDSPTNNTIVQTPSKEFFDKAQGTVPQACKRIRLVASAVAVDDNLALEYRVRDSDIVASVSQSIVQISKGVDTTADRIQETVCKSSSLFDIEASKIFIDRGRFVPLSIVKAMRKECLSSIEKQLSRAYDKPSKLNYVDKDYWARLDNMPMTDKQCKMVQVDSISAIDSVASFADMIVYNPPSYDIKDIERFVDSTSLPVYVNTPPIARGKDIAILESIASSNKVKNIIVNNIYGIELFKDKNIIGGIYLNGVNSALPLHKVLSVEGYDITKPTDFLCIYSILPLMHFCHCPIKATTNIDCSTCKGQTLSLTDDHGSTYNIRKYKIAYCYHQMLNSVPLNLLQGDISKYQYLFYDFTACSARDINAIINHKTSGSYTTAGYKKGVK